LHEGKNRKAGLWIQVPGSTPCAMLINGSSFASLFRFHSST
jgi:hypothetical protein